jgi:phosphoglycolate phosphatase-like HAD superfamily hydrolase
MFHHCTMLTAPAPPKRLFPIVFSDLDGTLLDHETYLFDAAQPALNALKARDIPLTSRQQQDPRRNEVPCTATGGCRADLRKRRGRGMA